MSEDRPPMEKPELTLLEHAQLMQKALVIIDGLCLAMDPGEKSELGNAVYQISHAAHQMCGNPHIDWLNLMEEHAIHLEKANIMKVHYALNERGLKQNAQESTKKWSMGEEKVGPKKWSLDS